MASSATLVPPSEPKASFTTAFAMLLYNVCYLAPLRAWRYPSPRQGTRSVIFGPCVAVANWDGTSSLSLISRGPPELGIRRSHETTPGLPPPTPPSFPLDFAQVLQATTASPAKGRRRVAVVGSGVVQDSAVGTGEPTLGMRSPTRRRPERIAKEEGWEVVEDDGPDDGFR